MHAHSVSPPGMGLGGPGMQGNPQVGPGELACCSELMSISFLSYHCAADTVQPMFLCPFSANSC